jgi:hypothetical protein
MNLQVIRPRKLLFLLIAFLLVGLGATVAIRCDPEAGKVRRLVIQVGSKGIPSQASEAAAYQALMDLGLNAYPELASMLQVHDTAVDRLYSNFREGLPSSVQRWVPLRRSKDELRHQVQAVVCALGPVAARALVGPLRQSLKRDNCGNAAVLLSLAWSVPESPEAVESLGEWLSKPCKDQFMIFQLRDSLFGINDEGGFWSSVPHLVPIYREMLNWPDRAGIGAQLCGEPGSNADAAIPDLIEVSENGMVNAPTNVVLRYAPGADPRIPNRQAAIEALGEIGMVTPQVLAALERGWEDPNPGVRIFAAHAIGNFGRKAATLLPKLLATLDTNDQAVLEYQIQAIGEMGPEAETAVPTLHHWTDPVNVQGIQKPVRRDSFSSGIRPQWHNRKPLPVPIPAGAAVALLQIAPAEANGLGHLIGAALLAQNNPLTVCDSANLFCQLRPLASEIVPVLTSGLYHHEQSVRQLTAFQILCLQPEHAEARSILSAALNEPDASLRCQAAVYYWRATASAKEALAVFREVFEAQNDVECAQALTRVIEFGSIARELSPQIKPLLTNGDWHCRLLAGSALRRIDPSALPPINEGYP